MHDKSNQSTRTYGLSNNGIWFPAFRSLIKKGFRKTVTFVPISSTGTASSNSNALTSVNMSAFNLQITSYSSIYFVKLEREAYSTRENRYPMHACGPPRNVSMLPHTPGMVLAVSLDDSQRSGLSQSRSISNFDQDTEYTYLNSRASFPHNASDRLIGRIGINTICPLRTLRSTNHSIMFNLHSKSVTIDRLTICYRKISLSYQRTAFRVAQHHLSQLPSSCQ